MACLLLNLLIQSVIDGFFKFYFLSLQCTIPVVK